MRLSPQTGKTDCHIIDFVDSTSRIPGIVTIPTLFGLDPDESSMVREFSVAYTDLLNVVPEESAEDLESRAEAAVEGDESFGPSQIIDDIPDPKSVTYIDYDNPFALVQDTSGAPHIAKLSTYAWVGCGDDIYVLECLERDTFASRRTRMKMVLSFAFLAIPLHL